MTRLGGGTAERCFVSGFIHIVCVVYVVLRDVAVTPLSPAVYRALWCRLLVLWLSECTVTSPECTIDSGEEGVTDCLPVWRSLWQKNRCLAQAKTVSLTKLSAVIVCPSAVSYTHLTLPTILRV